MYSRISRPAALLALGGVFAIVAAMGAGAQTTPPPPRGATTKQEKAEPVAPPSTEPQSTPKAPSRSDGLRGDIGDQSAISAIDKEMEGIREMVFQARQSAQRFHIARAKLNEILQAGKCAGSASAMQSVDRQEADTRRLLVSLAESCQGSNQGSGALAKACADERSKLQSELEGFKEDRDAVRRMCAVPIN